MDPDEVVAKGPRTVSRGAFGCLVAALNAAFLFVGILIIEAIGRAVGGLPRGAEGGLGLPCLILALLAADRVLKRLGMSRSGRTRELMGRSVPLADGDVADDEVVVVHYDAPFMKFAIGGCCVGCVLFALILIAEPGWNRAEFVALSSLLGLSVFLWWFSKVPVARADSAGITAYNVGFLTSSRFVPWSEIATCEIETYCDTFGDAVLIIPVLNDRWGEPHDVGPALSPGGRPALDLRFTRAVDQERLVAYIKAKLPKPQSDPWDREP